MPLHDDVLEAGRAQADLLAALLEDQGPADAELRRLAELHRPDPDRLSDEPTDVIVQLVYPPGGHPSEGLPVVAGHILIYEEDLDTAVEALGDVSVIEAIRVTPRVMQLTLDVPLDDVGGGRLYEAAERIAEAGLRVSFDHVTPCNGPEPLPPAVAVKSAAAPKPVSAPLPPRPVQRFRSLARIRGDVVLDPAEAGRRPQPGEDVIVAIIDTGIDDRAARAARTDGWLVDIAGEEDPTAAGQDPDAELADQAGHGTAVAGVVQQVAPDARVVSYQALYKGVGSEVKVAQAMLAAGARGAHIINLSLSTRAYPQFAPLALEDALYHLHEDVLVVAAAGNDGAAAEAYPGAFDRVIAVGAMDVNGRPAEYSNQGPWVDVSTLGTVATTFIHGTVPLREVVPGMPVGGTRFDGPDMAAVFTGTSFSCPKVAGQLAVLLAQGFTPPDAVDELLRSGRPEPGFGVVVDLLPQ